MLRFEELPEVNSPRWLSLEDFEGEEWKDVVGYEDRYSISSYGRLKRKAFNTNRLGTNCVYTIKPKIIKAHIVKNGYNVCTKRLKWKKALNKSVHRMVAEAFITNPNNFRYVNHKDENKTNNCVYNLEWCTAKYNTNYGTSRERRRQSQIKNGNNVSVVLYGYEGNVIKEYETIKDAAKELNISVSTITPCCEGKITSARGYHFRYKGTKYKKREMKQRKNTYTVYKEGRFLFKVDRTKDFCNRLNISYSVFRKFLNYGLKRCRGLDDYEIQIRTQEGKSFKVINGKIDFVV